MTEPTVYTIPDFRLADFVKRLDKLNRKAKKYGNEAVSYKVLGHEPLVVKHPDFNQNVVINATQITVSGSAPKLGNWSFIARVELLENRKTSLIHTVPGTNVKVDDRFRSLGPNVCEHCNSKRFRRDTFIVCHNETGEQKQVGRQCLADFTGINSPERAAYSFSLVSLFDEATDQSERGYRDYFGEHVLVHQVLALTSAYISKLGWTPRSAEFGTPIAGKVAHHFWIDVRETAFEKAERLQFDALANEPEHQDRATRVVEWIKNELANNIKSDYEQNLVALTTLDLTTTKHLGIVCSAVAAYQRAMNLKIEYAKRNADYKASRFVGNVGDKISDVKVKVLFVKSMESYYGPTTLVKFVDDNQNIYSWFASGDKDFVVGNECTIKGAIKGHKEYNEIQETQLTRVKVA